MTKCPKCGKTIAVPKGAVTYLIDELGEGDDMFETGVVLIVERELTENEQTLLFRKLYEDIDEDSDSRYQRVVSEFSCEHNIAMYLDQQPKLVHLWEEQPNPKLRG